jgi:hypothetical protein
MKPNNPMNPMNPALEVAVSEAVQACVEYAAVGDALGYPGVSGRERLLDAVTELSRWLRASPANEPPETK